MTSEKTDKAIPGTLNIKEICSLYKISRKTWKIWYEKKKKVIGEMTGGRFTPRQVEIIFQEFGCP